MQGTTRLKLFAVDELAVFQTVQTAAPIQTGQFIAGTGLYPAMHGAINLRREELFELGQKGPYTRWVNYPVVLTEESRLVLQVIPKMEYR